MVRKRRNSGGKQESNPALDYSKIKDKIKPVDEILFVVSMLVYGRSGTGKTTFSTSFPKPILLIDVREEGTDSVRNVEGVDVISVTEWDDIERLYWYLESGKSKYKSVIIDTITQCQDLAVAKILKEENKDFVTQPVWGRVAGLMKQWIVNYRDLPLNSLFIAQDRTSQLELDAEEDQLIPEIGPQVIPSVAKTLNAAVKVIGQSYIYEVAKRLKSGKIKRTIEFRLRVGPHPYYTTKIRKPKNAKIPEFLKDPSYDDVVTIMKGDWGKEGAK